MFVSRSLPAGVLPLSLIEVLLGKMPKVEHDDDWFIKEEYSLGEEYAEYLLPEDICDLDPSITRFNFSNGFLTGSFGYIT